MFLCAIIVKQIRTIIASTVFILKNVYKSVKLSISMYKSSATDHDS